MSSLSVSPSRRTDSLHRTSRSPETYRYSLRWKTRPQRGEADRAYRLAEREHRVHPLGWRHAAHRLARDGVGRCRRISQTMCHLRNVRPDHASASAPHMRRTPPERAVTAAIVERMEGRTTTNARPARGPPQAPRSGRLPSTAAKAARTTASGYPISSSNAIALRSDEAPGRNA